MCIRDRLCLDETARGASEYEKLWRKLGLSVDWSLRYSTIDEHCQRTSQKSFIELYKNRRIYRSVEPVIWDTHFETALAQADLDTITRKGQLHDISFTAESGENLIISTTRPELLPACVSLYCNSKDKRYQHLIGTNVTVPLFNHKVTIRIDDEVDIEYGTGLMMVCTFGDSEDVHRWKRDDLELRTCIEPNGKMSELAGKYHGMTTIECRKNIINDLKENDFYKGTKVVEQAVSIAERSETPVEYIMAPHWFIKVMDLKDELLSRSDQLNWHPDFMKVRLDQWIEGLKFDWNITRQRFYGVPFPVWYCKSCEYVVLPNIGDLPIDPTENNCPLSKCPDCGSEEFQADEDVMDTWMTSSLTPLINANWANSNNRKGEITLHPMDVRVQAYEIIRTWLFYTVVKSHLHENDIPWKDVMISGWGLNEQGKKISKRDLDKYTDKEGFNRYNPYSVIEKYGADALRHWATNAHLGHNLKYSEKDIRAGRKIVVKLWNSARYCVMQLENFSPNDHTPEFLTRSLEDKWIISELHKTILEVSDNLDSYNYGAAKTALERFFWDRYCDNYLEFIKDKFWNPERYSESELNSTRSTLWESLRVVISLFAPFLPFVTEEIYQRVFREHETAVSLHISGWPISKSEYMIEVPEIEFVKEILDGSRKLRSKFGIPQTKQINAITFEADDKDHEHINNLRFLILGVVRAKDVSFLPHAGDTETIHDGIKIGITQ